MENSESPPVDGPSDDAVLTLEPLLEAVRSGLEEAGWMLSGVQKTTSHHYEGRWEGESSRSAYLFFHRDDLPDTVSVDVFLDETTRGLRGNLALVVEGPAVEALSSVPGTLERLARAASARLPDGYRRPVSFRIRLSDAEAPPAGAGTEVRFKLHLPGTALEAGASAVSALASATVEAFVELLRAPEVEEFL